MKNGINHHKFNTLKFEVSNILLERRRRYTLIINPLSKEEKITFPRLQNTYLSLSKTKKIVFEGDFLL